MGTTLNRDDLAARLVARMELEHAEARKLVDDFTEEIALAMERGENVRLDLFGAFYARDRGERRWYSPMTPGNGRTSKEAWRQMVWRPYKCTLERVAGKTR